MCDLLSTTMEDEGYESNVYDESQCIAALSDESQSSPSYYVLVNNLSPQQMARLTVLESSGGATHAQPAPAPAQPEPIDPDDPNWGWTVKEPAPAAVEDKDRTSTVSSWEELGEENGSASKPEVEAQSAKLVQPDNDLFIDLSTAALGESTHFYLEKSRDSFGNRDTPGFNASGSYYLMPGFDILMKVASFLDDSLVLRAGPHYDFSRLAVPDHSGDGFIGRDPFKIDRHRPGVMFDLAILKFFDLQFGVNLVKYRVDVSKNASKGLDVGAPPYFLEDGSTINNRLGVGFRESLILRRTFWNEGWLGFLLAIDFTQDVWNSDDIEIGGAASSLKTRMTNDSFGLAFRAGLSIFLF